MKEIDEHDLSLKKKRVDWAFEETILFLSKEPSSKEKTLIEDYISYLSGELNGDELKKRLVS